jgi:hypothetical protein
VPSVETLVVPACIHTVISLYTIFSLVELNSDQSIGRPYTGAQRHVFSPNAKATCLPQYIGYGRRVNQAVCKARPAVAGFGRRWSLITARQAVHPPCEQLLPMAWGRTVQYAAVPSSNGSPSQRGAHRSHQQGAIRSTPSEFAVWAIGALLSRCVRNISRERVVAWFVAVVFRASVRGYRHSSE